MELKAAPAMPAYYIGAISHPVAPLLIQLPAKSLGKAGSPSIWTLLPLWKTNETLFLDSVW